MHLDPQEIFRERMGAEWRLIEAATQRMADMPSLGEQLRRHYDSAAFWSSPQTEFLDTPEIANARIEAMVAAAKEEILAAHPGGARKRRHQDISMTRDSNALARGVALRTLYRDEVREDSITQEWARAMQERGAQFRTLVMPFRQCIVIDRRVAFIGNHLLPEEEVSRSACLVRDPAVVAYIAAGFEELWRAADVWQGEPRGRREVTGRARTTRQQREILRDTTAGIEQRITAKRLGMALRTVSTEIAELRVLFGAGSLQELMYLWALSPDRLIDDQAVDSGSRPEEAGEAGAA